MRLESLKLITFDVTDTLLKFRIPPWQYYTLVARDLGFVGTENEVKSKFKISVNDMLKKHPNFGKNSISYKNWWSEVVKMTFKDNLPVSANVDHLAGKLFNDFKTPKCWCVTDGGNEILDLIKQLNIPMGVISNFDPRVNGILKNFNLYDKFNFILTSYDAGYSKPHEMIFKSAIKASKLDIKPSEALHIGDDLEKDYRGAKAAGWHAIIVKPNIRNEMPPDVQYAFNSLSDLCSAIKLKQQIL